MSTLDDKLLGEKLHYYCSSSEDEGDDEDSPGSGQSMQTEQPVPSAPPPIDTNERSGYSTNVGIHTTN